MPAMNPGVPTTALLALFLTLPAAADFCDLDLRYENGAVRWKAIVGATNYTVLETYGVLKPPIYYSTLNTSVPVNRRASAPVTVNYIVTAEIEPGVRIMETAVDACTGSIDVELGVNAEFRRFARKAVVPVVGSTPGAFGGRFKTALEMRGLGTERGRLVFHPAGKAASDDDPSIPYEFLTSRVIVYDDVVAAMGQSGIGSLDIIPDDDSFDLVPEASVRLYNDTSLGTFGTFATPVLPYDYLRPPDLEVRIPDSRFRVNIGLRALADTQIKVVIYRADGRLDGFKDLVFPAGWMQMTSASDFAGRPIEPGQRLVLLVEGASIPFYTITENETNDPSLILAPVRGTSRNVSLFVD